MDQIPPGTDLSKIPLMQSPTGVSNFVDPPSPAVVGEAVGITLAILTTFFLALRLTSNLKHPRKRLAVDDYLSITSYALGIGYVVDGCLMKEIYRHMWDIPLTTILKPSYAKKQFSFNLLSYITLALPKIAIFVLYMRFFKVETWFRVVCWSTIAVYGAATLAFMIGCIVQCVPKNGGPWQSRTSCGEWNMTAGVIGGAFNLTVDLILFLSPLPIIYSLNISKRKRIGLGIVFMVSILGIICSIISLYYRVVIRTTADKTWDSATVDACVYAESFITIIVSCTPAVYSLWSNHFIQSSFYTTLRSTWNRSAGSQSSSKPASVGYTRWNKSATSSDPKAPDDHHIDLLRLHPLPDQENYPAGHFSNSQSDITKSTNISTDKTFRPPR